MKSKKIVMVKDLTNKDLREELESFAIKSINTFDEETQICATCGYWDKKHAENSRTGYIIPNSLCKCTCNPENTSCINLFPASIKQVSMLWDEGENCHYWKYSGTPVEVMIHRG